MDVCYLLWFYVLLLVGRQGSESMLNMPPGQIER